MKMRLWIAPLMLAGFAAYVAPAAARPQCSSEMNGVQGELVVITEDGRYCEASPEDRSSYEQRFVAPPVVAQTQIAGRAVGQSGARSGGRGTTNVVNSGCVNPTGDTRACLNTRFDFSKAATHVRPVMVGMF